MSMTDDVKKYLALAKELDSTNRNWWNNSKVQDIMAEMEKLWFTLDSDEINEVDKCLFQASQGRKR